MENIKMGIGKFVHMNFKILNLLGKLNYVSDKRKRWL